VCLCQRFEKIVYYLKISLKSYLVLNIGSFENKAIAEYLTKYPKTISFFDGLKGVVNIEKSSNVEQLHVVVKKKC